MKEKRTQRGITLIALIITIVILLILAVVTINSIKKGQIIDYAKKAASDYEEGENEEAKTLQDYLNFLEGTESGLIIQSGYIPEGGVYTCVDETIYKSGDKFPSILNDGDKYTYGDYIYTHSGTVYMCTPEEYETYKVEKREQIKEKILEEESMTSWDEAIKILESQGTTEEQFWQELGLPEEMPESNSNPYWSVKVIDNSKKEYGSIVGKISGSFVKNMTGTFENCTLLITVPEIPSSITDMTSTFRNCTSLVDLNTLTIPDGVTSLYDTFGECTSLTNLSDLIIPNSVTEMSLTFVSCSSLITAPEIPNGVIRMWSTFGNCTSLRIAPVIPNSVTDLTTTFINCTSLETVPIIPSSVSYLNQTFSGCTSLTGTITVDIVGGWSSYTGSNGCYGCFKGTKKAIILTGSASDSTKGVLASTANNGNVKY